LGQGAARSSPVGARLRRNRQVSSGEFIDISTELESWYARDSGQHLLARTRQTLERLLDTAFGYHSLQLGNTRGHSLLDTSPINHRIYAATRAGEGVTLITDADELPLESDSIDTIIAHHSLDFAARPHQVLREIQRVLTPQGHLMIIGFNPYSLLGISRSLRGLSRKSVWHRHTTVSENRLTDWLHLLGCEVQDRVRLGSVPLAGRGRLRQWLAAADDWGNQHNLPSGGLYIVHAIKQVSAVHRPRRHFRLSGERLIGLVPKPAAVAGRTPLRIVSANREPGKSGGDDAA
jgi:SAM-dependent methyltransferase